MSKQSTEANVAMNQMLALPDKDFKSASTANYLFSLNKWRSRTSQQRRNLKKKNQVEISGLKHTITKRRSCVVALSSGMEIRIESVNMKMDP